MTLRILGLLAALTFCLAPRPVTAQGTLVVNGGFNGPSGWTLTNSAGYEFGTVALDDLHPSESTDPTASQTINGVIPGVTYVVSGQYRGGKDRRAPSPADPSFGVAIEGTLLFEAVVPALGSWQNFVFLYTATSPSAVLSLSAQRNGSGVSSYIDNIAMQPFPSLAVSRAGTNIVVQWHTNVVSFVLQSTTELPSTLGWQNVTNSVVVAGSNYTVTLSATNSSRFFRLAL